MSARCVRLVRLVGTEWEYDVRLLQPASIDRAIRRICGKDGWELYAITGVSPDSIMILKRKRKDKR